MIWIPKPLQIKKNEILSLIKPENSFLVLEIELQGVHTELATSLVLFLIWAQGFSKLKLNL